MTFSPADLVNEMGVRTYGVDYVKRVSSPSPVQPRGGWSTIIREPYSGAWQQNKEISRETQLAFYAVYACITLIANDIGKLRPRLMELDSDGIWQETESPAYSPVLRKPNRYQNHIQFKEWWMMSKLSHGNTYALKGRDNRGVVTSLYLLDPGRVRVLVAPDGSVYYELWPDDLNGIRGGQDPIRVPASEIIHDRMNCLFHPLVGVSPIYACGVAAGHGLAIQEQSLEFFNNGARPSGILVAPGSISQEAALLIQEQWQTKFSGPNSGRVAVIGDGMNYQPMVMNATDAQLVEQLEMTAKIVCSVFHVPPAKIGLEQDANASNAEIRNQNYYSDCIQSPIEQFELCMDEGLGIGYGVKTEGRTLGVDLDLDGLIRMDSKTQVETLTSAVGGSIISVNNARKKLDLPPVKGGDTIWMQQQNYSLEALIDRDRNEPFAKPEPPSEPEVPVIETDTDSMKAFTELATMKAIQAAREAAHV